MTLCEEACDGKVSIMFAKKEQLVDHIWCFYVDFFFKSRPLIRHFDRRDFAPELGILF